MDAAPAPDMDISEGDAGSVTEPGQDQEARATGWDEETLALLGLSSLPGVGYWTLYNIARTGRTFASLLRSESRDSLVEALKKAGGHPSRRGLPNDWQSLQQRLREAGETLRRRLTLHGVDVIHSGQGAFPERLRHIADPPRWLFYQGSLDLLRQPSIALVGTRQASKDGYFLAKYVIALLSYYKVPTVSGLADGIDRAVHQYSLRFGLPTVAILGTGILRDFPADSGTLREEIVRQGGAVITEYLPSQTYSAENFVRRNRLQAGLASAVIPVEWHVKGGTAHTVRYAFEQGKRLVCLRMPDWMQKDHPELSAAARLEAPVFTVPGEEGELKKYLERDVLGGVDFGRQLDFWS